jgi:pimeloyl-ACP methyl ester carboxylesterase
VKRAFSAALAASALCALSCGSCAVARSVWSPARQPATVERYVARTADGWELELIRYRPEKPLPGRRPLLLLHGIATNLRNLDYDARHSLARAMAGRGLDTWAMSLRGHGGSEKGSLFGGGKRYDWDLDTYCTQDLPAALAFVRARTEAEQPAPAASPRVDVVGHSMGGLILYCLLARGGEPAAAIGAAATLGSPLGFRWGPRFTRFARLAASAASRLPVVALDAPTLLALPLLAWFPEPAGLLLYNPANIDPEVWSGFLAVGVDDDSPRLAAQFLRFIEEDKLTSRDGAVDYELALPAARTPVLVVAGKVDQLGFPPLVRRGYDALGGPKRWLLVGEENGASADYGHMDLLLGEHADADVFAPLAGWFEEQALLR